MNNKDVFANNLNNYMKINNKTRRQVCTDLRISYYTFSDWCNAKKYPRMDKVSMLAEYFGIRVSDLVEEHHVYCDKKTTILKPKNEYQKIWDDEMKGINFSEQEIKELIKYAKYLISIRKENL